MILVLKYLTILVLIVLWNTVLSQVKKNYDSVSFYDSLNIKNFELIDTFSYHNTKSIDSLFILDSLKIYNKLKKSIFQYTFYSGLNSKLSIQKLASLCGPAFWFSPDEPELGRNYDEDSSFISIPEPYPCNDTNIKYRKPVVYYQVNNIEYLENDNDAVLNKRDTSAVIDLNKIESFTIYYTHYYRYEIGVGKHPHDNEQVKLFLNVKIDSSQLNKKRYKVTFEKVIAYAHDQFWYDNMFELDKEDNINMKIPLHILVEEGKHASCPDINADGYYSPGYDVNVRTSDAWGIRDVIRTDKLYTAYYQSWMTKVRSPKQIIFPPLPKESPYLDSSYPSYELRLIPAKKDINKCNDRVLASDFKNYIKEDRDYYSSEFWREFKYSYAFSYRYDQKSFFTITFPLLLIKNIEPYILEGWLVHRLSFYQWPFRWPFYNAYIPNIQYSLLYTPSASRFLDPYISGGLEYAEKVKPGYVFETGLKFRFNTRCPILQYWGKDFLGIRLGIKYKVSKNAVINSLNMIFEIGLGPF